MTTQALTVLPKVAPSASELSEKHEQFVAALLANGGNLGEAYRAVYPNAGTQAAVWANACRLRAREDVSQRIAELTLAAAERTVVSVQQQLVELAQMAAFDLTELQHIAHRPCATCHVLYDRDLLARRPMPDMSNGLPPHIDCADAKAHQRLEMRPMEEWPLAARRLYDGVEVARDGTLRPVFRDRNSIQDMVNRMLGAYITRTENKTLTVSANLPDVSDVSPADLLTMWKANQRRGA
jgi:Terminase small subunit